MPDPTIFVDADACPVKDEALRVAERQGLVDDLRQQWRRAAVARPDGAHRGRAAGRRRGRRLDRRSGAGQRHRADRRYSAGRPGARQGRHVLGFTGKPFTEASIGMALAMRELNQHLRETGESKGYNAGFRPADRSAFLSALDTLGRKAKSCR